MYALFQYNIVIYNVYQGWKKYVFQQTKVCSSKNKLGERCAHHNFVFLAPLGSTSAHLIMYRAVHQMKQHHIHVQLHPQLYRLTLLKNSIPFISISLMTQRKCCRMQLPVVIKVQTSKTYETCKHRSIFTTRVEVQHEKKPVSNLKSMLSLVFEQITTNVIEIFIL